MKEKRDEGEGRGWGGEIKNDGDREEGGREGGGEVSARDERWKEWRQRRGELK